MSDSPPTGRNSAIPASTTRARIPVGWYQHRYATDGPTNDYSAFRADTFHQLLLPKTFFGWLNVTPRAGGRLTYGDTDSSGWDSLEAETPAASSTPAPRSRSKPT